MRKLISQAGLLMGLNLLVKPIFILGIDRQMQNLAGPEAYGSYYAAFSFVLLGSMLLDAGLSNYNARRVAIEHSQVKSTPIFLGLRLSLALVYALVTLLAAWLLHYNSTLLSLLVINQVLNYTLFYLRSNLQGLQLFIRDGVLSVLDRSLTILFCLPLLSGYTLTGELLLDFALVQTGAYLVATLIALLWNKPYSTLLPRFSPKEQWQLLKQTLPYALLGLLMTFYARIDAVMLVKLLPNGHFQAGEYAAGYRLLDAISNIPLLLSGMLMPVFAKKIREGLSTERTALLAGLFLLSTAWIGAMSCYVYSNEILALLYQHTSAAQTEVFRLLMLSYLPIAGLYVTGSLLTASGKLKILNSLSAIALLTNVALNLLLIPRYGAVGAAVATLFTQFVLFIVQLLLAARLQSWSFNVGLVWRSILFMLLSSLLTWFSPHLGFVGGMMLSFVGGLLLLPLLVPSPIQEFQKLIRRQS